MKKFIQTTLVEYLNENMSTDKRFVITGNKFQLFLGDDIVAESGYNIEQSDEWFDKKYVTIYDLKTVKEYREKGFAKYLLKEIFDHVKNELKLTIITLIVYKNNYKATNLYFDSGFEIFIEYDNSYSLIKKLT